MGVGEMGVGEMGVGEMVNRRNGKILQAKWVLAKWG
jgi:hypothetical protein